MKRFILFFGLGTALLFTHAAMADGYWGVKGAIFQYKSSSVTSPINVGAFAGVDVTELGSNPLAIEADITTSLIKGKSGGTEFGQQTTAFYAALRTAKTEYFKVKLGTHNTTTSVGSSNSSYSALSYGIGFGFNDYEIEYTVLKAKNSSYDDISMISVGYRFP